MVQIVEDEGGTSARTKLNDTGLRKNNYGALAEPTPGDDNTLGYEKGSYWEVEGIFWICANPETGNANWTPFALGINHSHILAQITDAGNSAGLHVGTTPGTVAPGDHTHTGFEPTQTHVTSEEITAGDGTGIKSWAPVDIKAFITEHEAGAAVVAPTITSVAISPEEGELFAGQVASMVIVDTAGVPPAAQTRAWLSNGIPISGATGVTFAVTETQAGLPLVGRVTRTPPTGSPVVVSSAAVIPIGAPQDLASPPDWTTSTTSGVVTYDASALFLTPGDASNASVTFELEDTSSDPHQAGMYVAGVFAGGPLLAHIAIDPNTGEVSLDTAETGALAGVPVVVRATNDAGSSTATITLTVATATVPTIASAHISLTQGGSALLTEVPVGTVLWLVGNTITGIPTPTQTRKWYDNAVEISGQTGESLNTTGRTGPITGRVTVTNPSGSDNELSAGITLNSAVAVLWNSADKHAGAVLSDGDRVVKTTNSAAEAARATKYLTSADAKCYLELAIEGAVLHSTGAIAGLVTSAINIAVTSSAATWSADGVVSAAAFANVFEDGIDQGSAGIGTWNFTNEVLCIAINMTLGKVWFRNTAGAWTGDPVAGTGGYDIVASSVTIMCAPRRNTGEPNVPGVRLRSLASEFTQAVPSGFVSYGQA